MPKNIYGSVDGYAAFFIAYKARKLTKSPFFNLDDYEDLSQDLMLAYLQGWPHFDESKGDRRSFIKAIINNHARYLVDVATSQKRWTGAPDISLSSPVGDVDEAIDLIDILASADSFCGDVFADLSAESLEFDLDLRRILSEMPNDIKETFNLLTKNSITEAAKLVGVPRTTMSSRAKRLRNYLEECLLKK